MARRKKKGVDTTIEDLNLVPIMNMMVVLIPVVLVGTSLIKIGVVDVSSKFGQASAATKEDKEKPLGLMIALSDKGFRLSATGGDVAAILGEQTDGSSVLLAKENVVVPVKQSDDSTRDEQILDYPYRDLYNRLVKIKKQYKKERMVTVTASPTIPFKYIIATMDAVRDRLDADDYAEEKVFREAKRKSEGSVEETTLFDQVVFALVD